MFQCLPEPIPPETNPDTMDSEVGLYVKDLAYAGRDCRDQLSEVGHFLSLQDNIDVTDVIVEEEKEEKSLLGRLF